MARNYWNTKNSNLDKYMNTPRKVFDKTVDKIESKRKRDKEDHRADIGALLKRLVQIEKYLKAIDSGHGCKDPHCKLCYEDEQLPEHGNEELD